VTVLVSAALVAAIFGTAVLICAIFAVVATLFAWAVDSLTRGLAAFGALVWR
jgi:hypothetical protein